jgi:hypothetical protein
MGIMAAGNRIRIGNRVQSISEFLMKEGSRTHVNEDFIKTRKHIKIAVSLGIMAMDSSKTGSECSQEALMGLHTTSMCRKS